MKSLCRRTPRKGGYVFVQMPSDSRANGSEIDLGAGEDGDAVVSGLARRVHLVTGIGLERQGAVQKRRYVAKLQIGFRRVAAQDRPRRRGDESLERIGGCRIAEID